MSRFSLLICIFFLVIAMCASAQVSPSPEQSTVKPAVVHVAGDSARASAKSEPPPRLKVVDTVISSLNTNSFADISCDAEQNVYLKPYGNDIYKIDSHGKTAAMFVPEANPDIKVYNVGHYTTTPDGEVYVSVGIETAFTRYLLVYKPDGTYKSNIKLETPFALQPVSLAVFSNGNILITGLTLDRESKMFIVPFAGIFRSDGTLLKQIALEPEEKLPNVPAPKDRPAGPLPVYSNRAVAWGQMRASQDGNVYILRWGSPAKIYAVSASGEVVKRFSVDPGDSSLQPRGMYLSGSRIAILFMDSSSTKKKTLSVVDNDGNSVASYDLNEGVDGKRVVEMGCYNMNPERFTFLGVGEKSDLQFIQAQAR
jgi:hypothetical protein